MTRAKPPRLYGSARGSHLSSVNFRSGILSSMGAVKKREQKDRATRPLEGHCKDLIKALSK
jgi:hypothetical protein